MTILVTDGDNGGGYSCVGTEVREISVPFYKFSFKPKTALKMNSLKS